MAVALASYRAARRCGTDAGDVVLGYARQILELNDQAVAAARGIAIGGSVRFGVPQDFGDSWLPGVLARFSRAHPSVLIEARVDRANKLVEPYRRGWPRSGADVGQPVCCQHSDGAALANGLDWPQRLRGAEGRDGSAGDVRRDPAHLSVLRMAPGCGKRQRIAESAIRPSANFFKKAKAF